jgi:CRP-like cAMP-binding protein
MGHRIFDQSGSKRSAYVSTFTSTDLIYVNKGSFAIKLDIYVKVAEKAREFKDNYVYERLKNTKYFSNHTEFLKKILEHFKLYTFTRNQVIVEEGKPTFELYFLLDGIVRVTQLIPYVLNESSNVLEPVPKNSGKLYPVETLSLSVVGTSFPLIPDLCPPNTLRFLGPSVIDPKQYFDFYNKLVLGDVRTHSRASIECPSSANVAAISLTDFCSFAPPEMICQLVTESDIHIFTMEEILEEHEIRRKWNNYRRTTVNDIYK